MRVDATCQAGDAERSLLVCRPDDMVRVMEECQEVLSDLWREPVNPPYPKARMARVLALMGPVLTSGACVRACMRERASAPHGRFLQRSSQSSPPCGSGALSSPACRFCPQKPSGLRAQNAPTDAAVGQGFGFCALPGGVHGRHPHRGRLARHAGPAHGCGCRLLGARWPQVG